MKRGRPRSKNTRTFAYRLRLNFEEYQILQRSSELSGQNKANVIRIALRDYYENITREKGEEYEDSNSDI